MAVRLIAQLPSVYDVAREQNLKFYVEIDDCIAAIAAVFGGGRQAWRDLSVLDLLKWTNRAIEYQQREAEMLAAGQGVGV